MEGGYNIRSRHLNLFPLNGGEQDTLPSTGSGKVDIKLDDQLCVGSGGDWLEELLLTPGVGILGPPIGWLQNF